MLQPWFWRRSFWLTMLVLLSLPRIAARAEEEWVEGTRITGELLNASLILDESTPWRQYYYRGPLQLSAEALKNDKEIQKFLPRYERLVKVANRSRGMDWSKTDWRDCALLDWGYTLWRGIALDMLSQPPPANWTATAFDDSEWVLSPLTPLRFTHGRSYFPDSKGNTDGYFNRTVYLRTCFQVADPAAISELKLTAIYRGGLRVFLNGKEIARQHLPQGELKPDAKAEDYPMMAYLAEADETRDWSVVGDIRVSFDRAPKLGGKFFMFANLGSSGMSTEKGFKRLSKLRDRELQAVRIPAASLVKGINVLAVEIHASQLHPIAAGTGDGMMQQYWLMPDANPCWSHAQLTRLALTETSGKLPSALGKSRGVQVWADDMHNWSCQEDSNPWPGSSGSLRFAGCLGGAFSGKAVVRTAEELKGLKVRISDLTGENGAVIPASGFRIRAMAPRMLRDTALMGWGRGVDRLGAINDTSMDLIWRVTQDEQILRWPDSDAKNVLLKKEVDRINFYDQIGEDLPERLSAGAVQPYWLTLAIPTSAKPGVYKGSFSVEAAGVKPLTLPVEAEVTGWRLPEPRYFNTRVTLEQSPFALARWYKTPLWSDKHFELIEASFKQMARTGNCMLIVPVIQRTEYGNVEDTIIHWIRKKDGSLAFDYRDLDRYLDLAVKHMGKPRVISFTIMHYQSSGARPMVSISDEASGAVEKLGLGWYEDAMTRYPYWKAFATALYAHLKEKGLEDSMHWGNAGDNQNDIALVEFMRGLFPHIRWTANPHAWGGGSAGAGVDRETFRCVSEIYSRNLDVSSRKGWKQPETYVNPWCPRAFFGGISPPYFFRLSPELALHVGLDGVGRWGFDYLDHSWNFGYQSGEWNPPGMPCQILGWPGKKGMESSARFEALVEGIQEAEARIFLEQAVDRNLLPKDLAAEASKMLEDRIRNEIPYRYGENSCDTYSTGWRERSLALFKMAAKVAERVGLDVSRLEYEGEMPALGRTELSVLLRNWTGAPRAWKAAGGQPWIKAEKVEGTVAGDVEVLKVIIDGSSFKPAQTNMGSLKITDAASNKAYELKAVIRTTKPVELLAEHLNFNVTVGKSETRQFRIHNRAASPQPWELKSSVPWLAIAPPSGTLSPDSSVFVNVTAAPKEAEAKTLDVNFQFLAAGGLVNEALQSRVWVLPVYRPPERLPFGRVIFLQKVEAARVKLHQELLRGDPLRTGSIITRGPVKKATPSFSLATGLSGQQIIPIIGKRRFERGMWVLSNHETVYNIEGLNLTAFSAFVGIPIDAIRSQGMRELHLRINYEVYVDGKLRTQSGLLSIQDGERTLVVEGLEGAKELRLVTRLDSGKDNQSFLGLWADANLYEKTDKAEENNEKQKAP